MARRQGRTRRRGERIGRPLSPPPPMSDRPFTYVEGDMLMPGHQVSARITKIFKNHIHDNGYCWKNVPKSLRRYYFEKFKRYYRWDEGITEKVVIKAFMKQASKRYKDLIYNLNQKNARKRPDYVSVNAWESWVAHWNKPEVRAKSRKASQNRMSEVAGPGTGPSRHTGGSRSAIEHLHVLREDLQRDPHPFEFFERIHKRKDGTFIDERSRLVAEEVQERVAAATRRGQAVDMVALYLDVVGGVIKDRIFGMGTAAFQYYDVGSMISRAARSSDLNVENLRRRVAREMQRQFDQHMEEVEARLQHQLAAEREEMEAQMAEMWDYVKRVTDELRLQGHLPSQMGLDE